MRGRRGYHKPPVTIMSRDNTTVTMENLRGLAGDLNADLSLDCPRVTALKTIFTRVQRMVGRRKLRASAMHDSGLMAAVVKTAVV